MFTSSSQLQNRSFHVVERTRTSSKCQKMAWHRRSMGVGRFRLWVAFEACLSNRFILNDILVSRPAGAMHVVSWLWLSDWIPRWRAPPHKMFLVQRIREKNVSSPWFRYDRRLLMMTMSMAIVMLLIICVNDNDDYDDSNDGSSNDNNEHINCYYDYPHRRYHHRCRYPYNSFSSSSSLSSSLSLSLSTSSRHHRPRWLYISAHIRRVLEE